MMRISNRQRVLGLALAALASFGFAGCDDDVIYVHDGPPAIPTGVTTVTGDGQVEIYWNPVLEDDVAGYNVYRSPTLTGAYYHTAQLVGRESTGYLDLNVTNGVTYYYAVDAYDFAGNESDLSYEDAFDTPRPAGSGEVLYASDVIPAQSGLDFSEYFTSKSSRRSMISMSSSAISKCGSPALQVVIEVCWPVVRLP